MKERQDLSRTHFKNAMKRRGFRRIVSYSLPLDSGNEMMVICSGDGSNREKLARLIKLQREQNQIERQREKLKVSR